jgi:hypothetical protein
MNCDCNMPDLYWIVHKCRHEDCPAVDHLDVTLIPPNGHSLLLQARVLREVTALPR